MVLVQHPHPLVLVRTERTPVTAPKIALCVVAAAVWFVFCLWLWHLFIEVMS
jgi:hypothetical protein